MAKEMSVIDTLKNKFLIILIAVLLVIVVSPILREIDGRIGLIISGLLLVAVPLASIYAFSGRTKVLVILIILGVLIVLFSTLSAFFSRKYLIVLYLMPAVLLYMIVIILILKHILTTKEITADLIYGAISTFLLIGILWAALYMLVELFVPGSFSGVTRETDLAYFSLVTLTTVGFGDISPLSVLAQRLAVLEAAAGSVYIGVIIALIVGKYIAQQIQSESRTVEKEEKKNGLPPIS